MNSISKKQIDEFVKAVAGKDLSIRDIALLANGYFKGTKEFRQQINNGNITFGLKSLKETAARITECSDFEQRMLKDLELVQKYMQKTTYKIRDNRLSSCSFLAQANLIAGAILSQLNIFSQAIRDFHDKSGQT